MIAPDIGKALTALGVKVRSVPRRWKDGQVVQLCLDESRILVTKNHDAVYRAVKADVRVVYLHFRKGTDMGYVAQTLRIFSQLQAWEELLSAFPGESVESYATYCSATTPQQLALNAEGRMVRRRRRSEAVVKRRASQMNRDGQGALDL